MPEDINSILGISPASPTQNNETRTAARPRTVPEVLFTFKGRITRSDFWLKGVLPILPFGIFNNILFYGTDSDAARAVSFILAFLCLWPSLAIYVKRLHDRDRSGWFLLTLLIPLVGIVFAIWLIVEAWFLRGTIGKNRFGDDPLGNDGAQVRIPPATFGSFGKPISSLTTECIVIKPDGSILQMTDRQLRDQVEAGSVERTWAAKVDGTDDWKSIESLLGLCPATSDNIITTSPKPHISSQLSDDRRERRAKMYAKLYFVMLGLAVLFGILGGVLMRFGGPTAADPVAIITLFILFPAFIFTDAAFRTQQLLCPLRAVSLPLTEGLVIALIIGDQDPFAVCIATAFIYAVASFTVVAVARAIRK